MTTDIDHIDPKWKEGRDYQLVCGLDAVFNMCERDRSLNQSKSNRFVPWRWGKDELGGTPVEPGDICLFLEYGTNRWVLEEFMGVWWWDQSVKWGYFNTQPLSKKTRLKISKSLAGRTCNPRPPMSDEQKQKIRNSLKGAKLSNETKQKLKKSMRRYHAQRKLRQMSINDPLIPDFDV